MSGQIEVTFGTLEEAIDGLAAGVRAIEEQLSDLRAGLAPMRASWTGAAADAYDRYQAEWDAAAKDLHASLGTLHSIATGAHANYTAAETANGRTWAG